MAKLGFLKQYRPLVIAGSKTATLRRWKRPMLRCGQTVTSPGIGNLRIASVKMVQWKNLTEADARADGFNTLDDLHRAVNRIYPKMATDGRSWFKIGFELLGPLAIDPPAAARPSGLRSKQRKLPRRGTMKLRDKLKLAASVRTQLLLRVG